MVKNNKTTIELKIQEIIDAYKTLVTGIDQKAKTTTGRAYGGIVRMGKGKLVESIAEQVVLIAWEALSQDPDRLTFSQHKVKVPIKNKYLDKIKNPKIRKHILENINNYYSCQKVDKHVLIDKKFVMGIECKSYTENAMMKRILVDFSLVKQGYPNIDCVLFQLESQLGGDYSELKDDVTYGSPSTHTLLSNFDIDLQIITLLKGGRQINKAIHESEYYKPLAQKSVYQAIEVIKGLLKKHI